MQREDAPSTPKAFFNRRLHSFLGLWLVLYLIEHLLTNSEAALLIGADGEGFITMVNFIHSLPYLPLIETLLLGVPFAFHIIYGIKYLRTMKQNTYNKSDGSVPHLPEYPRNQAYTWQRITSWLLIVFILLHVVQMRFLKYPESVSIGNEHYHMVKVDEDVGLETLSARIGIKLFDSSEIASLRQNFNLENRTQEADSSLLKQELGQKEKFIDTLEAFQLKSGQSVAVSSSIGTAFLMNVRETFKSPLMLILYTFFVVSAVFHACNGLWTFTITWGMPLSMRGQNIVKRISLGLMAILMFLGLSAVWGTYLINLRH